MVSWHFQLTQRNGIGLFLVVAYSILGPSACVTYFIVSVADTLHIYLICHTFWSLFVIGKAAGLIVLLRLKWSVSLSPCLLNTKSQVVRRQLIVSRNLFLPWSQLTLRYAGITYCRCGSKILTNLHTFVEYFNRSILVVCYDRGAIVSHIACPKFKNLILHCLVFLLSECGKVNVSAKHHAPSHRYAVYQSVRKIGLPRQSL